MKKIFYLKSYNIEGAANEEAAEMYVSSVSSTEYQTIINLHTHTNRFRNGGEKKTTFVSRISRCVSSSLRGAYDEDEDSVFAFTRFKPEHQKYFDLITEKNSAKNNKDSVDDEKKKKEEEDFVMKTPQKKKPGADDSKS